MAEGTDRVGPELNSALRVLVPFDVKSRRGVEVEVEVEVENLFDVDPLFSSQLL